jgi:RNA polymerase sigma-70 factor (ECF subfamily)
MPEPLVPADVVKVCLEAPSEAAWINFVRCFQPLIAAKIRAVVGIYRSQDKALIDDLVQDTFLRLCKDDARALRAYQPRGEDTLVAYIRVVAKSAALQHFETIAAKKRAGLEVPVEDVDPPSPPEKTEQAVLMREIGDLLRVVEDNPVARSVFWLRWREGFTAEEISRLPHVNLNPKGVESCLDRMLKKLCLALGEKKKEKKKGKDRHFPLGGLDEEVG